MNIITHFYKLLEINFNNYLKNYFSVNLYLNKSSDFMNYCDFIKNLDNFQTQLTKDIFKSYIEYIDEAFFNSSYRKRYCESKGFIERKNYVTLFGEISFKRRYYFDKSNNEHFYFVDLFLGIPKRKHFDPFICAEIVDKSASNSYSKAGALVSDKIGSRINSTINISRATARNIALAFNPCINEIEEEKRVKKLFVMLDEKFVGSRFNEGKDFMIKAAIIFEGTELEYKTKKKENSMDRYRLIGTHACASINNDLKSSVYDYINNHYDTDYLEEICFMGDCATWIKNFSKYGYFVFNDKMNTNFSMDGFHFSHALKHITTNKNPHWYNVLELVVRKNNIDLFCNLCERFIKENPSREITIRSKMKYILNNWKERQLYQNKPYLKCSMESHISHFFADLFTSRPKAYSKKGLEKLLEIRLLKINGYNLKELDLNSIGKNFLSSSNEDFSEDIRNLNLDYHDVDIYDMEYEISPLIQKALIFNSK